VTKFCRRNQIDLRLKYITKDLIEDFRRTTFFTSYYELVADFVEDGLLWRCWFVIFNTSDFNVVATHERIFKKAHKKCDNRIFKIWVNIYHYYFLVSSMKTAKTFFFPSSHISTVTTTWRISLNHHSVAFMIRIFKAGFTNNTTWIKFTIQTFESNRMFSQNSTTDCFSRIVILIFLKELKLMTLVNISFEQRFNHAKKCFLRLGKVIKGQNSFNLYLIR